MIQLSYLISRHSPIFKFLKLLKSIFLSLKTLSLFLAHFTLSKPQSDGKKPDMTTRIEFDPTTPSIPISYPIKTLEDLESRSYFSSFHYPFNVASVRLQEKGGSGLGFEKKRRVLVCHDFKGGYVDDKWVQGGNNPDAYSIWHWYLMDVFVYFSHDLVTLPPPCWTNTAHRHGVRVLGTFITEWEKGRLICDKLLSSKESTQMYAERLTELAVALGFDGWLINMEIELDKGQIPNMLEFVRHLTHAMHSARPGSLVIWYDSVTIDGHLSWQDQLNEKNKPFFDVSDGIFVNYTWKENYPRLSAAVAGDRKYDVYMGIDVFGRNTYGGGQWNTNVALDLLKKEDVSAAMFAPGWVFETNQPPDFETAQNRWWDFVEKSSGIQQYYPKRLPFYSNFDQGRGFHYSVDGRQVSAAPWCNICCQTFQPFLVFNGDSTAESIRVFVDRKGASYNGGGNITFEGSLEHHAHFSTRLFKSNILLGDSPLHIAFSVKSDVNSLLGLSLEFSSAENGNVKVLLACDGNVLDTMNLFSSKFSKVVMPDRVTKLEPASHWTIVENCIAMNGQTLTDIQCLCYRSMRPRLGSDDQLETSESNRFHAVLGHISMKTADHNSYLPPSTSWIVEGQHVHWTSTSPGSKSLSVELIWKLKEDNDSLDYRYNVYVEKLNKMKDGHQPAEIKQEFLGVAYVKAFYISDLPVPSAVSCLKFTVQVCSSDGVCQNLNHSPAFLLKCNDV